MAIAHLVTHAVSRSAGGNAVHSCAYNTRSRMYDEQSHRVWDYSRKAEDVLWQGLYVPQKAPEWMQDRAQLWNEAERSETRINSRTARHIEVSLPHELTPEQNRWLLQDFVRENFQRKGMVADVSMHRPTRDGDERNVHAHILLATRVATPEGFAEKNRDLDKKETLLQWREQWEKTVNRHLERHGVEQRIDMRSFADQDLDRTPGIHLGKQATAQERKGQATDRGDDLNTTRRTNAMRVIQLEMHANDNGNLIDQAKADEQKKRQEALLQAQKDLEQTTRKTAADRSLLEALGEIIKNAARLIARTVSRAPRTEPERQPQSTPQQRAELRMPDLPKQDQAREIRAADSAPPGRKPEPVQQKPYRTLMEINAERASKVKLVYEDSRDRVLERELWPTRRRRPDEPA